MLMIVHMIAPPLFDWDYESTDLFPVIFAEIRKWLRLAVRFVSFRIPARSSFTRSRIRTAISNRPVDPPLSCEIEYLLTLSHRVLNLRQALLPINC